LALTFPKYINRWTVSSLWDIMGVKSVLHGWLTIGQKRLVEKPANHSNNRPKE